MRQCRQKLGKTRRNLPNVVEALHLMQDVRVAGGRLLNMRTDVALQRFQKPDEVHQFVPGTVQHITYRDLPWI